MKIIITAATKTEWQPAANSILAARQKNTILFHESGVGMLATAVSLMQIIASEKPDCIIQVGIAGTFNTNHSLASVFVVKQEIIADLGVVEKGKWMDIFDMKLTTNNAHPFVKKQLPNPWLKQYNLLKLPTVIGVTVNEITTQKKRKQQILEQYKPTIESMEGAAFHYVCSIMNIPFLQMRATSNIVGERNKNKWRLQQSIEVLNNTIIQLVNKL